MTRVVRSISITDLQLLENVDELCRLEGWTFSRLTQEALKEFFIRHWEGNPQTRLAPKSLKDGRKVTTHDNPMTAQRRKNIDILHRNLKQLGPKPTPYILAWGSKVLGVTPDTVKEYLRILATLGQVTYRYGKVVAV